jgi:2,3-bisphosphoglycerate-independent phosphoglycerate mutase
VKELQSFIKDVGVGKVASVSGRFYAMDRDKRWERIESAYEALVFGKTGFRFSEPSEPIEKSYRDRITDEFIVPSTSKEYEGIRGGDGMIFFNFRADRARELTYALNESEFSFFERGKVPHLEGFVCMTPYDDKLTLPTAYQKAKVESTLGELVSKMGGKQLRIAETEKYAHVTYFFNGGSEEAFEGEKRVLVPSPREVKTYDLKPEMSAEKVTENLLQELKAETYQLVVVNFANPDMVGHTGNLGAAISAVETVDKCLGKIVNYLDHSDAFMILTADHGNCEKMLDDKGNPLTSHTLLPVPFFIVDPKHKSATLSEGKLCDIAPTILALWGVKQPSLMTGKSLIN